MAGLLSRVKRWGLGEWSTFATILCAIDCTVIPLLMVIIPILGWASPDSMHSLHNFSHWAAIYIMIPLATLAVCSNYLKTRQLHLAVWGAFGISLVFIAHSHDTLHYVIPLSLHHLIHSVHDWHTPISLFGAANIIASNYLAHSHGCCHQAHHHHKGGCCSTASSPDSKNKLSQYECADNRCHHQHDNTDTRDSADASDTRGLLKCSDSGGGGGGEMSLVVGGREGGSGSGRRHNSLLGLDCTDCVSSGGCARHDHSRPRTPAGSVTPR
eukprot:GHVQ01034062.1.p1 GENE.GHVQ01034062.1~~GHVQ01034062.1.p1  ORF type:complete len:269 (+),score=41.75 GHVQ01034062.1:216-1022(+)